MEDDENMDRLRKSWEIEDHWILRRDFLLTHKNKFPPERLLCLAQLFVNIETLGTQYDEKLMDEVKELAMEVPSLRIFRERQQELLKGEQFKPPPKVKKTDEGTRQVTHQGYQRYQDNYNNRRQDKNYQRYDQFNQQHQQNSYYGGGQRGGYGRNAQHVQTQGYHTQGYQQQQGYRDNGQQYYQQPNPYGSGYNAAQGRGRGFNSFSRGGPSRGHQGRGRGGRTPY